MAIQNNEELVRTFYRAYEDRRLDEAASYFDSNVDFTLMSMPNEPRRGKKELQDFFQSWYRSFPDMKSEIVNIYSSGNKVIVEAINRGTHEGPLKGPKGTLEPTHQKIEVPSCDVYTISNGKVTSWKCYWQGDLMMNQLGVIPLKKQAA